MTPTASPYTSVVSLRSRRYRTFMTILLGIILVMSLYGGFSVMPKVRAIKERADLPSLTRIAKSQPGPGLTAQEITHAQRTVKARKLVVYLALAYWGVCSLLIVSVVLIAWLDFREMARNFALQARSLRQETVATLQQDLRRNQEHEDEVDG